jgi:hypothetical protein
MEAVPVADKSCLLPTIDAAEAIDAAAITPAAAATAKTFFMTFSFFVFCACQADAINLIYT